MLRFLTFLIGLTMVGTSAAEGGSPCPVDSIPNSHIGWLNASAAEISKVSETDEYIAAAVTFVITVTKHIAARLGRENLCPNSAESKELSQLQFVQWFIDFSKNNPPAPAPRLDVRPSHGCRISSPWIELAIERKPIPWIRAVSRWNERQFIADQAILAGVKNVPPGVAKPLVADELMRFEKEYENSEVRGKPAAKPIEKRIPPDLLWLFRHYPMESFPVYHFGGNSSLVMNMGADGYTKLVLALIDRCFDSADGANLRYNSILDVADPILLEQYKIDTPAVIDLREPWLVQ